MKTLLVWETNPENIDFYVLPGEVLTNLHGKMLGECGLEPEDEKAILSVHTRLAEDWAQYKVDSKAAFCLAGPITVVHTGEML